MQEDLIVKLVCTDRKKRIRAKYLLYFPYFEASIGRWYDEARGIKVDYKYEVISDMVRFVKFGTFDPMNCELVAALCYYMSIDASDDFDVIVNRLSNMAAEIMISNMENNLLEHQPKHITRLYEILRSNKCVLDISQTGRGKTYTTLALCKILDLKPFIICTESVKDKWLEVANKFRIEILEIFSFQTISSRKCKHGYLSHSENPSKFNATNKLRRAINKGIFFIVDELHKCKNKTLTTDSIVTVINELYKIDSKSRSISLTATPLDAKEPIDHIINIGRVLGMCGEHRNWYEINKSVVPNTIVRTGLNTLISLAKTYECEELRSNKVKDIKSYIETAFNLIAPKITCAMDFIGRRFTVNNTYLEGTDEENAEALRGYGIMENAITMTELGNRVNNIGDFMKGFHITQKVKCFPIFRAALEHLTTHGNDKIVIFIPHIEMLEKGYKFFQKHGYGVLTMSGKDKSEDRVYKIALFQEDSSEIRIFLTNTKVSSTGIDLDDQHGNRPRRAYIIPEYTFIDLIQSFGRFDRANTKSDTLISIVYLRQIAGERSLLESLNGKNKSLEKYINHETGYNGDFV